MSHISEFLDEVPATPGPRKDNITSVWDCCTTASKTAKVYRSQMKSVNRIVSYSADIIAANEEFEHPESKELIEKTTWSVYRVSPLWNVKFKNRGKRPLNESEFSLAERLEYDEAGLKRYSDVIRGFLLKNVSDFADNPVNVSITTLRGLRGSRNDKDALKIDVNIVMGEATRNVFKGILCGVETSGLDVESSNTISLPVFLTNGLQDTTDRVIHGLRKCFDCVISPLLLIDEDMRFACALLMGLDAKNVDTTNVDCTIQTTRASKRRKVLSDRNSMTNSKNDTQNQTGGSKAMNTSKRGRKVEEREEISLVYTLPDNPDRPTSKINSFTISLASAEVKELRRLVHKAGEAEFTDDEKETFHAALSTIIRRGLGVCVDQLELTAVSLPLVSLTASGKVRILHTDLVKVVLKHLTSLCQGNMLSANPSLGVYDML